MATSVNGPSHSGVEGSPACKSGLCSSAFPNCKTGPAPISQNHRTTSSFYLLVLDYTAGTILWTLHLRPHQSSPPSA